MKIQIHVIEVSDEIINESMWSASIHHANADGSISRPIKGSFWLVRRPADAIVACSFISRWEMGPFSHSKFPS